MQDRSNGLKIIDFEITHRCNKHCRYCSHRVSTSDYEMSLEDYDYIIKRIGNRDGIEGVLLTGGEPLMHPDFEKFIYNIQKDFPKAGITVFTNGRLLPEHYEPDIRWGVTHYPGWNDEICHQYEVTPNVSVARLGGAFWDVFEDPNFDEATAKKARDRCLFTARVMGRKLYNCCLSEPLERDFDIGSVHMPFGENWRSEIHDIPTWKACAHCFRAASLINENKMYSRRTKDHGEKAETTKIGADPQSTTKPTVADTGAAEKSEEGLGCIKPCHGVPGESDSVGSDDGSPDVSPDSGSNGGEPAKSSDSKKGRRAPRRKKSSRAKGSKGGKRKSK